MENISIEQLVEYVNLELSKDAKISVNKVCDKIGIKKTTLRNNMTKNGYKYDAVNRKYILENSDTEEVVSAESSGSSEDGGSPENIVEYDKLEIKEKLISLADNYDGIMKMLEQYAKGYDNNSINDNRINDLPVQTVKDYRTSIRVNNVVWEQFKNCCKEYDNYTQLDLLSIALMEFTNKYKKVKNKNQKQK